MTLADKTVLNVLAKSSEAVLLMLSSIIMVRAFPKEEYGTFLQIMLIANTVILFTIFGIPQSIYYFFQKSRSQRVFIFQNMGLSFGISLVAALLVFGAKNALVGWLNNPLLAEFGWVAPLLIMFRAPSRLREPFLISHGSLLVNSALVLLCNLLFYSPVIIAALFSVSLPHLLQVMIVCAGLELCVYFGAMMWILSLCRSENDMRTAPDSEKKMISLKEQFKYAFPIGASSYIGIIGRQIDQYIVSVFFTPTDFAVYSRGAMQIPFISTLQFTINDIMMPKYVAAYAANDIKSFLQTFHMCITKVAKINYPIFALFFAVAPSVMTFLYTEQYSGAASIFRVYLFMLLANITLYAIVPRASGRTSCIMVATILALAINVTLSLVLVAIIGPVGAAIATVASGLVAAWYYLFQSCKILKVRFSQIFPWNYLAHVLTVSLLASIPVYLLEALFDVRGEKQLMFLVGEGLLYGYGYIFLMLRKHLIEPEELASLEKWFRFDVRHFLCKITFFN